MIADVLFVADHFVMVTTIEIDYSPDQREVEKQAWDRLGAEYGIDWVGMTRQFINKVSIEVVEEADALHNAGYPNIPEPGDPADASLDGA